MDVRRWVNFGMLMFGIIISGSAAAEDFRIDTDVFQGAEDKPVSETITIFTGDVIYDFLLPDTETGADEQVTMFDVRRGRIVLMDAGRRVQTTLSTDDLLQFTAGMKALALQKGDTDFFDPKFEVQFDETDGTLTLASRRLTYQVQAVTPKHAESVRRIQEFADWYARLNAVRPGNLPPFGRIALNAALAERNMIPQKIERTILIDRPVADKKYVARSEHTTNWLLSTTDRRRIDRASRYIATFQQVTPDAYWEVGQVASKD